MVTISVPVRYCAEGEVHSVSFDDEGNVWTSDHDWLDDTLVDLGLDEPDCLGKIEAIQEVIDQRSAIKGEIGGFENMVFGFLLHTVKSVKKYEGQYLFVFSHEDAARIIVSVIQRVIRECGAFFKNKLTASKLIDGANLTLRTIEKTRDTYHYPDMKDTYVEARVFENWVRSTWPNRCMGDPLWMDKEPDRLKRMILKILSRIMTWSNGIHYIKVETDVSATLYHSSFANDLMNVIIMRAVCEQVHMSRSDAVDIFNKIMIDEINKYTASVVTSPGGVR
jgi:hypothetical protein